MIQRIQSLFLLLGAGSALGLFGAPLATTPAAQPGSALFADTAFQLTDHWLLMAAFGLAGLVMLAGIFLFGNRKRQILVTQLALVATLAGLGAGAWFFWADSARTLAQPGVGSVLPALTLIFGVLALRNIHKDEKLVRSIDRLRS